MVHRVEVNVIQPFSERRFIHSSTVFLPRTLHSVAPRDNCRLLTQIDADYREAAFTHLDAVGMSNGSLSYCADAIRTFATGA